MAAHNGGTNVVVWRGRVKLLQSSAFMCVCSHLHRGEVSLLTYLEELLLFNLSSVKLTYCLPLTADVWPAQPLPHVVVCAHRYHAHTHTYAHVASCSICQSTSAASSFIKAGNKSVLWCERRKVFMDLETEDKTAFWRTEDVQRAGFRRYRYLFSSSLRVSVYVSPVCARTSRHLSVPGFVNPTAPIQAGLLWVGFYRTPGRIPYTVLWRIWHVFLFLIRVLLVCV